MQVKIPSLEISIDCFRHLLDGESSCGTTFPTSMQPGGAQDAACCWDPIWQCWGFWGGERPLSQPRLWGGNTNISASRSPMCLEYKQEMGTMGRGLPAPAHGMREIIPPAEFVLLF